MYETLTLAVDSRGVATITLNRPDARNALSAMMIAELTEIARALPQRPGVRVVVLQGAGAVFCAGGDLAWMRAQIAADRATRLDAARQLAHMLQALNEMPLPLIGRIHGGAYGGGVGLACVCDVAVAAEDTRFGLTETRLGLIPATIGPYVIARIGEGAARRIFFSARIFGAPEARALGLIGDHAADLDAAVEAELTPYLSTAPGAVAAAKAMTRALSTPIGPAEIEASIARLADIWDGAEAAEGIDAFFARRAPAWMPPKPR
ncbi:MAG: crotonase/enoyl-CoA hydratase family protein [Pseudomonadota bacterium]